MDEPLGRFDFDDGRVNAAALPLALALAWLLQQTSLGAMLAWWPVTTVFHETGHAVMAWLTGRFAIPIPIGLTLHFEGRSTFTTLAFIAAAGTAAFYGVRERRPYLVVVSSALLLVHLVLAFFVPQGRSLQWVIFAGCAGELVLGAFTMASFYFEMPDGLRWDFWRYPALGAGAMALVSALRLWHRVAVDIENLPVGSLFGDREDGDMDRLIGLYGWTPQGLSHAYSSLGTLCTTALLVTYVAVVARSWRATR